MRDIDEIVQHTLSAFVEDIKASAWSGRREREAVSLYAFRHLASAVRVGSVLHDVAQIGIEVPVPQLAVGSPVHRMATKPKAQVCKDIVIWPEPAMTCWDNAGRPTVFPTAIMLWKTGAQPAKRDIQWLQHYSVDRRNFVGYAIAMSGYARRIHLRCARVSNGEIEPTWLDTGSSDLQRT